jgi:hypothetical protein
MSPPQIRTIHAHVLTLNGTPIHMGTNPSFLRRTGSGQLFKPEQSIIKPCEKGPPIPINEGIVGVDDVHIALNGKTQA